MMDELMGLGRLLQTCTRLQFDMKTTPPAARPPVAGTLVDGQPLDPLLAAFFQQFGEAWFATDRAGIIIGRMDDSGDALGTENQRWRKLFQDKLALQVVVFGGEPLMTYRYATLPALADENMCQPVVRIDTYEDPFTLPIASNVDKFFELYSRYLEQLAATPGYNEHVVLTFPWDVPHLLARDKRLVELIQNGAFEPLLSPAARADESVQQWLRQILDAAG
jgi:hypothetical protein